MVSVCCNFGEVLRVVVLRTLHSSSNQGFRNITTLLWPTEKMYSSNVTEPTWTYRKIQGSRSASSSLESRPWTKRPQPNLIHSQLSVCPDSSSRHSVKSNSMSRHSSLLNSKTGLQKGEPRSLKMINVIAQNNLVWSHNKLSTVEQKFENPTVYTRDHEMELK